MVRPVPDEPADGAADDHLAAYARRFCEREVAGDGHEAVNFRRIAVVQVAVGRRLTSNC